MQIYNTELGKGHTFIIAETCSNIISYLNNLEGVVEAVANTGADALKIQLFKTEYFPLAEQESKRSLEFPRERFSELVKLCHNCGLACGASVFDEEAVECVVDASGDFLKLAVREWNNLELREWCMYTGLPILQSFDYRNENNFDYVIRDRHTTNPVYLACCPEYPAEKLSMPDCDLIGWSSHTSHWVDCIIATADYALVIEKHIAFNRYDPESAWSLQPSEFASMVSDLRRVEGMR